MALDHYVSQVHLKNFYSPLLGEAFYAIRKDELKIFHQSSSGVCRIEENSTNAYLREDRIVEEVEKEIFGEIQNKEFVDMIITLRVSGMLKAGKSSDVNWQAIFTTLYEKGAYFVMKNTSALTSEEFEEIKLQTESVGEIEDSLIKEHQIGRAHV